MRAPRFPCLLLLLATLFNAASGAVAQDPQHPDPRLDWWRRARFGMFIHWGLYSIPAGVWGDQSGHAEWIMNTAHIPVKEYEKFLDRFDPQDFDAEAWAQAAKGAGMEYLVITSKHHDGFALFDSAVSDYDVMATPFHRDIMKEIAAACRHRGLRFGWYHSIMDWHHPDYLPRRGWEKRSSEGASFPRYLRYLRAQVSELLSNYGAVDLMWFDGNWESTWSKEQGRSLYEMCRRLQPQVIVNDRVGPPGSGIGDFGTPEQEVPATGIPGLDWETCMTMNDHWGYNSHDHHYKSTTQLIRTLVEVVSKGGNLLLNVGPTAAGAFPPEALDRLRGIGAWMEVNGESIHGCGASPFAELEWGRCTTRREREDSILYLHVLRWPDGGSLELPGLANEPRSAHLLAAAKIPLRWRREGGVVVLQGLPPSAPDPIDSVIALRVEGTPRVHPTPRIEAPSSDFVDRIGVRIPVPEAGVEVHYTLDGSEPDLDSPLYSGPIELKADATVCARSFLDGAPVSGSRRRSFTRVSPWPALQILQARAGLRCEIYTGKWERLPDFEELEAVESHTVPDPSFSRTGVPEHQGRLYEGFFLAPADGLYLFALTSDDGARLWLDDRLVVDDDGMHAPLRRRGSAPLARGYHRLRLAWFNGGGPGSLTLQSTRLGVPPPQPGSGSGRFFH